MNPLPGTHCLEGDCTINQLTKTDEGIQPPTKYFACPGWIFPEHKLLHLVWGEALSSEEVRSFKPVKTASKQLGNLTLGPLASPYRFTSDMVAS